MELKEREKDAISKIHFHGLILNGIESLTYLVREKNYSISKLILNGIERE